MAHLLHGRNYTDIEDVNNGMQKLINTRSVMQNFYHLLNKIV